MVDVVTLKRNGQAFITNKCVGCWDKKKVNGYDNTSIYSLYINGNKVCHAYDRKTFLEVINDLYNRGIIQM